MRQWHSLKLEDIYSSLEANDNGLSSNEADGRLNKYGYNELRVQRESLWKKIIEPFRSIFIAVLVVAVVISFLSHETLDGIIILIIIAVNTAIYYSQQYATSRVLRSLKKHNEQYVSVLRDAIATTLSSRLLVPGDIILLSEGQRVPADARVVHEENLYADESTLTGESLPIKKVSNALSEDKQLYERVNMLFAGTYIISGSARALVVATGPLTEFGRIAKLAVEEEPQGPMQQKINAIVSRLIKVLALVALIVFALSLLRGIPTSEALRFVMSMSVAAVPEDLPIALTIILVLGMRRMAKKNALVRSTKAIEDIGLTTVVATDKTGTLTKNNLQVTEAWNGRPNVNLKEAGLKALGNTLNIVEPFDQALKKFAGNEAAHNSTLLKNYPFNQLQRMSGALWNEAGQHVLYVKGAPEHLLNLCNLDNRRRSKAESELHRLIAKGFRVIAFAKTALSSVPADLKSINAAGFDFLGFIAFADELRPESKAAIDSAHQAGISVKMITGDHFETAFQIGQALGISSHRDQVILGGDLPHREEELTSLLKVKSIFARILPEQKFNILKALKRSEITAMTGDGVNDVPALTNAHVGIAMGSGNDIAKDAGDIVLLNNSFSSIISAISESRAIYDNIKRMLFYLLSTTLGEILTMIGALLVGLPLPVTAIQILWINLVTDTALVIPLGLEPPEEDHMKRPPRHPKAPILDRVILTRICLVGAAMAAMTLAVFGALIHEGYSLEYAQTIAFMMLVAAQWMNAFNARSERLSAIRRARIPNYKLLAGLSIAVLLQLLVMFGPLKEIFGIQAVSSTHLAIGALGVVIAVYTAVELHKLYYRRETVRN